MKIFNDGRYFKTHNNKDVMNNYFVCVNNAGPYYAKEAKKYYSENKRKLFISKDISCYNKLDTAIQLSYNYDVWNVFHIIDEVNNDYFSCYSFATKKT